LELEAFGKTMELELSPKNINIISIVFSTILVLTIGIFLIYPKIISIKDNKQQIEKVTLTMKTKESKYLKEKEKVDRLNEIYQKQKDELELLQEKFEKASMTDILDLKIAVQKMIKYLGIKVTAIGQTEKVATKKKGYVKKYVPYSIEGEMHQLGRLFYYLENSKDWLLTFSGNGFNIKSSNEKGMLQVKFKIGSYIKEVE